MTPSGILFVISAPSGAGKTSLVNALVQSVKNVKISISHTVRPKRPGEQHGVNYHFVTKEIFQEMQAEDMFLESAEVFGNLYGTSKAWVEKVLAEGRDVLLEIDWQGAQQIRQKMPQSVSIFIIPPSRETLLNRLNIRDQDDEKVIQLRMKGVKNEISHYHEYDYLICNDKFEDALEDLKIIVRSNRLQTKRQIMPYATLIKKLLS